VKYWEVDHGSEENVPELLH